MRVGRAFFISVFAILAAGTPALAEKTGYKIALSEYRLSDLSEETIAKFDAARSGGTPVRGLVEAKAPRAQAVVSTHAGTRTAVSSAAFRGELTAWPQGARVELELNVPRFFAGSPLLLAPCRDIPVTMVRVRGRQSTTLLVRVVHIDNGSCR